MKSNLLVYLLKCTTARPKAFRVLRGLLFFKRIGRGTHWTTYYSRLFPNEVMKVSTNRGILEREKYDSCCRQKARFLDYCVASLVLSVDHQHIICFQKKYECVLKTQIEMLSTTFTEKQLSVLVEKHVKQTRVLWENGLIDFDPRYSNFALDIDGKVIAFDDDMIGSFQAMSQYDFYRFVKRFWIENRISLGKFHYLLEQHAKELLHLDKPINLSDESETWRFLVNLPINLWSGELPTLLSRQLEFAQKELVANWGADRK